MKHERGSEEEKACKVEDPRAGTEIEEPVEERVKRLEEELLSVKKEARENHEKFLRACADLENLKKRWEKERATLQRYAAEAVIMEILPVIDNLERAVEHVRSAPEELKPLVDGVRLTISQMKKVLEKFGVREIEALGKKFDPAIHHAISHEDTDEAEPDTVIKEFQKGYIYRDKLLRPSLVAVARKPATGGTGAGGGEEVRH